MTDSAFHCKKIDNETHDLKVIRYVIIKMSVDEKKPTKENSANDTIKLIIKDHKKYGPSLKPNELVKVLKKLSDAYYNTGDSLVGDIVYDYMRDLLQEKDPENPYLMEVGAPVKGTKEKAKLPFEMSSLNKFKPETDDVEKWCKKYKGPYVIGDKLDGASAQFYKDYAGDVFLYSRGDLVYGQNISHLIKYFFDEKTIKGIPKGTSIRGELIIQKENFKKISSYMKNARNAVSGLVNSKTVDQKVAKITEFVAYAILNPRHKQVDQMELLVKWGLKTVVYKIVKKLDNDILKKYLLERLDKSLYEMDGIVCVDDSEIYEHKGGYPKHAFAFKIQMETVITTVVKVIWNASMDGYLKPKVEIEPVDLVGTTIKYATAHNAKFIVDNKIGPNAKIKIIRSGDVIPKILEVVKPASKPQMPNVQYKWNSTNVDLMLKSMDGISKIQVTIKLLTYFFKTMGVKYLSEGIITKLVENEYDSIEKILTADKDDLSIIEGLGDKMVSKIYDEIDRAFDEVELSTFMAASHKFGRGLAEKKIREIINMYPNILTEEWDEDEMEEKILEVSGFSTKLAKLFSKNFEEFMDFYNEISKIKDISRFEEIQITDEESSDGEKLFAEKTIVFTGFRDKDLKDSIIKNGGKVSDSVSSKTFILICADGADMSSSKFKKAEKNGTKIMTKSEFLKKYKL